MRPKDLPLFRDDAAKKLLRGACAKHGVTLDLLQDLLDIQRGYAGAGRQHGITQEFSARIASFIDAEDK